MNKISYLPLTFVSTAEDIKKHISNTIIMKHVIESESQLIKLDELLESTQYGYTASAQQNGSHQLLRITDIQSGEVNWRDVPFCDCERPEKYIVQKGDILVARTGGTTGKSFLINDSNAPENVIYASYLIKLRADKEKVLPGYLNIFMNSYIYWSQITEMKSGSAQPNVNANKLKELVIPYCSLDKQVELVERIEQNKELNLKISKACSEYEKVKHVEEIIQEQKLDVDLYRRLIFQDAIQGKIVEQNENDEPASVLLEKIKLEKEKLIKEKKIKKEKALPEISDEEKPFELPKGWEWVRLKDLIKKIGSGSTPRGGKSVYVDKGIKFIRSQNVWNDGLFLDNVAYITENVNNSKSGSIVEPNDLLINITGASIGRCCIVPSTFDIGNVNQHVSIIRLVIDNETTRYYLHYCLISKYIQEAIMSTQVGISREGISISKLSNFLIPIPPLDEQKRIVEKVNHLMSLCDKLETSIEQSKQEAEKLMKAVLQEAFTVKEEVLS
ncbi:restriction endonuclease subunit S [Bacillus thuringiensis]|uniref:restriction endonuclease subunit S n=1 Tax=Bacillus thuringiensis TaxID=1428 RepID=UPI000BFBEBFC|nr:restriction endonuclease subunit S [Bacillus thuringiensis]PGX99698.1 hypothetical protein COE39_02895 [Bacillus thuringiensis]